MTIIFAQLHQEDRATDHFVLYLHEHIRQILFVVDKADSFSATAFRCLNHDSVFVSNPTRDFQSLFDGSTGPLFKSFFRDGTFVRELCLEGTVIGSTKGT